jgi:hypothetical protein
MDETTKRELFNYYTYRWHWAMDELAKCSKEKREFFGIIASNYKKMLESIY